MSAPVANLRVPLVEIDAELPLVMVEVKGWVVVRVCESHPVGDVRVPPRGKCHTALEGCAALVVQVPVQWRHDAVKPSEHAAWRQGSTARP
jgi:hypothetical protein